jgi:hypothetical protein
MRAAGFPRDDYTPHGYLDNPYDGGLWPGLEAGGVIRSVDGCGFGWHQPESELGNDGRLRVGVLRGDLRLLDGNDFAAAGVTLVSRYHSSRIQTFDFQLDDARVSLAFLRSGRDALLCRATVNGPGERPNVLAQAAVQRPAGRNGMASYDTQEPAFTLLAEPGPWYALVASHPGTGMQILDDETVVREQRRVIGHGYAGTAGILAGELQFVPSGRDDPMEVWIALGRGTTAEMAVEHGRKALASAAQRLAESYAEDDEFWSRAPRPVRDWPDAWRRGWVYDLETTRLMVRPPAGVFTGTWPTWRLHRPRVVLAENALDMLRLATVEPETAQRTLLNAFAAAPQANVPCLFANGSLNMVAEGGDPCGTSPAWCLPFHSIYLLYLSHPDRAWLGAIYPYLEAYLNWWTENRRDGQGWVVYRCTWEAGEDESPRLDPSCTGHGDIFHKVEPVELQAAMAHSALLLARMTRELGLGNDRAEKWESVHRSYTERTRSMWDAQARRFRDLYPDDVPPLSRRGRYWDAPADESPLQLTPLLYGIASEEQIVELAARLPEFRKPPWVWWASWTYTVTEAARAVGAYGAAGEMAYRVLSSVYPTLDRRRGAHVGALPGTSCEWWPDDHSQTSERNEAYGWGATTATLLLRHLFGFGPAEETDQITFELAPALCGDLLTPGRRLGFANLRYRDAVFDLELEVEGDDLLTGRVTPTAGQQVSVQDGQGSIAVRRVEGTFAFPIHNRQRYVVRLS